MYSIKYYLHFMRLTSFILLVFITLPGFSQKKAAYVSGKVIDGNENPLPGVSVVILGKQTGIVTSDSGTYRIKVPAGISTDGNGLAGIAGKPLLLKLAKASGPFKNEEIQYCVLICCNSVPAPNGLFVT